MKDFFSQSQIEKAIRFKELHHQEKLFVIPNAWDAGSAKILEHLGFDAVATTSAGLAFSLAKADAARSVSRDENLANANAIASATSLPTSVDLENGYGDDPETCAATILSAAKNGLVGCTFEDATGLVGNPIYDFDLAVARVAAAVKAARSLPFPFTLMARAENYLYGRTDLQDTVRRLVAFAEVGADVLYAPGLKTSEEIETIVKAVAPKPVNFLFSPTDENLNLENLQKIGVKRVSVGSTLARAAYSAFIKAAEEIKQKGTFDFMNDAVSYGALNKMFAK